jgi:hypothetical protein
MVLGGLYKWAVIILSCFWLMQESFTERGTGETVKELLQAAHSHRMLVQRMQESLHSLNSSLSNLRDEVMRKVPLPSHEALCCALSINSFS